VIPIGISSKPNPYQSLTEDLLTGYMIRGVMLFEEEVHPVAFTEAGSERQLWVIGGDPHPLRRVPVIDNNKPGHARIVDFLKWRLLASPSPDLFTFNRPADAKKIQLLNEAAATDWKHHREARALDSSFHHGSGPLRCNFLRLFDLPSRAQSSPPSVHHLFGVDKLGRHGEGGS